MKVGIIALGWLGKQLAQAIKEEGHEVVGSYAHEPKGIEGEFRYDINKDEFPNEIRNCELLLFNLPPSKIESIQIFKSFLSNVSSRLIFISSTSVYGQKGRVDEGDAPIAKTKNGKFLCECETLVGELSDSCIIRPGGLYGGDRHPANYMSGKTVAAGAEERVNLISGGALTNLILQALDRGPKIINAINSHHPFKIDYYSGACRELGIEEPIFEIGHEQGKVVSTQYQEFIISDPL